MSPAKKCAAGNIFEIMVWYSWHQTSLVHSYRQIFHDLSTYCCDSRSCKYNRAISSNLSHLSLNQLTVNLAGNDWLIEQILSPSPKICVQKLLRYIPMLEYFRHHAKEIAQIWISTLSCASRIRAGQRIWILGKGILRSFETFLGHFRGTWPVQRHFSFGGQGIYPPPPS